MARCLRGNGAHIDDHRLSMDPCQRTIWRQHDGFQGAVIRDTGDDDFASGSQLSGRLGRSRPKLAHGPCPLCCAIIDRQVIASTQEPGDHMAAHMPHVDKADVQPGMLRSRHCPVPPFLLFARENPWISSDLPYFTPKCTQTMEQSLPTRVWQERGSNIFPGVFLEGPFLFSRFNAGISDGERFCSSQWFCCSKSCQTLSILGLTGYAPHCFHPAFKA